MQKFLLLCLLACFTGVLTAQPIFLDQFEDGALSTGDTDKWDISETGGELLIDGNGTNGPWDIVFYGLGSEFNLTENAKVFIRAKSSVLGTQFRLDLADATGNSTNAEPQTVTLTDEYRMIEIDFGTINTGEVNMAAVNSMFFFINGGQEGYTGQVAIDYIAIGEAPAGTIMSDIYQDQMDSDSSLTSFLNEVPGFTRERTVADTVDYVTFIGDGTAGPWTPHVYALRPAPEFIPTNIDISDNPVIYVKMRSSVPGTTFRIDIQDEDNISSIGNAVTRILDQEWTVYEYNLAGAIQQGFENDACPTANTEPCEVNLQAIKELIIFVNGGTGQFAGTIDIDWISFGVSLDGEGPQAELVYTDEFENGIVSWTGGSDGLAVSEEDGSLVITGDGTSPEFGAVVYSFQEATDDQDTAYVPRIIDLTPAQSKIFVRARVTEGAVPLRIDIVDSTGLATNVAAITKRITSDWDVYSYDFNGNFGDAGYGGAAGCSPEMPCQVDPEIIRDIFLYLNPGSMAGMFNGRLEIDWISVGQPLEVAPPSEVGVDNYSDVLDNVNEFISGSPSGITFTTTDGLLTLTGDGTSPTFQQVRYALRDEEGNAGKANVASSNDKLFIRARLRDADGAMLRIDLGDEANFQTTNAGASLTIAGGFQVYEYDYANRYFDGGYGGTACPNSGGADPCAVDAERITALYFYPNPDNGQFAGSIDIDWLSFGEALVIDGINEFAELEGMRLFPNPATDEVAVEFDLVETSNIAISLFDGLGRRVLVQDFGQRVAGNHFNRLDVSELATGTYYVQVSVNGIPARATTLFKR